MISFFPTNSKHFHKDGTNKCSDWLFPKYETSKGEKMTTAQCCFVCQPVYYCVALQEALFSQFHLKCDGWTVLTYTTCIWERLKLKMRKRKWEKTCLLTYRCNSVVITLQSDKDSSELQSYLLQWTLVESGIKQETFKCLPSSVDYHRAWQAYLLAYLFNLSRQK